MTSADLSELPALWWENIKKEWTLNVVICAFDHVHNTGRCACTHTAQSLYPISLNVMISQYTI